MTTNAFLVRKSAIWNDPVFQEGGRGARKLLVTEVYDGKEHEAQDAKWKAPAEHETCPVQLMPDTEVAVFNHETPQDRHFHKQGTEIYMVIEGQVTIEVDSKDYLLDPGDMLVVNPCSIHEVKPGKNDFLCRVITVNCGGVDDKFVE